jgi:hypothetical protein
MWSKFLNLRGATFGALGGVAIGIFGLYTHVQARDFDPKFELWYLSKTVMGAIFGWFVFLLFYVGFLETGGSVDVKNHQVLYAISVPGRIQ